MQPLGSAEPRKKATPRETPRLTIEPGGHTATVTWVTFTPDGRRLVSAGRDKVVRVWDLSAPSAPRQERTLRFQIGPGSEGMIYAGALSPKGDLIAVAGYPYGAGKHGIPITLANFRTGRVIKLLKGHEKVIVALAFSPDGKWLASASKDGCVRIWRIADGRMWRSPYECRATLTGHTDAVHGLAWAPDSKRLVTGSDDKTLRIWRKGFTGWSHEATLKGHQEKIFKVDWSPDGRYIASASFDKTVRVWDGQSGRLLDTLSDHDRKVSAVAFSPDSRWLLSCATGPGTGPRVCTVWSLEQRRELSRFTKHDTSTYCAAISPDGRLVASTGGTRNEIMLWDPQTAHLKGTIVGTGSPVLALAFAPDGDRVAFGDQEPDDSLQADGALKQTFDLLAMEIGPDVRVSENWGRARLALDGLTAERKEQHQLAILRRGREVARVERWQKFDPICCYSFVPGGKLVVGSNYELTLHEAQTGRQLRRLIGHIGAIRSIAVSPDGKLVASGSDDQTFRLWSTETGELLLSVFVGSDREWVAWTAGGFYKSSVGGDRIIGWHVNQGRDRMARYVYAWQMRRRFERADIIERVLKAGSAAKAIRLAGPGRTGRKTMDPEDRELAELEKGLEGIDPDEDIDKLLKSLQFDGDRLSLGPVGGSAETMAHVLPPMVTVHEPVVDARVNGREARVRATVASELPVRKVTVLVNGRRTRGLAGITTGLKAVPVAVTVTLIEGENVITISAENAAGISQPASVRVVSRPPADLMKPRLYLLSIGVSRYQDPSLNLRYAAADAQSIAEAFIGQEGALFGKAERKLLLDSGATRRQVLKGLDWLGKSVTQRDLAVVSIAGHGKRDDRGSFFFLPHDGEQDDLRATCVRWTEFRDALNVLPCKVILVMDTCHSGAVTGTMTRGGLDLTDVVKELTSAENGIVTMTASTGRELSQEADAWGHGAFSLALVEALTGKHLHRERCQTPLPADYNRDGVIILDELAAYVANRVKELTAGAQHPTVQRGDVPSFPVAVTK